MPEPTPPMTPLTAALAAVLTAALVAPAPAPAPAQAAAPAYTRLAVEGGQFTYLSTASSCDRNLPAADYPDVPDRPMSDNAAPLTATLTTRGRYTAIGDPGDVLTSTATLALTATATSARGLPRTIAMTARGTTTATATRATSACSVTASSWLDAAYALTLARPMWATLTVRRKGQGYAVARIRAADPDAVAYHAVEGEELDGESSATVLLAPGRYQGYVGAQVGKRTHKTANDALTARATITFAPVGAATLPPTGSARRQLTLPAARSCATHDATATLTAKTKRLRKVRKVALAVAGRRAVTLKGTRLAPGRTVRLRLPDADAAEITATVALRDGRTRTLRAHYLPCTG